MIFTDRSRYKTQFSCPFERYLQYHFNDTGIVKPGTSIPLATGIHTHSAIEQILKLVQKVNDLPRSEDVRRIVEETSNAYEKSVAEFGLSGVGEDERIDHVVKEQTTLIHGLIWAWAGYVLPYFLEEFRVLHVEQEMERILGCSCGLLGVGQVADHVARNCEGVVLMTRPDVVARKISTDALVYVELKTGSRIDPQTFEGDVQFAIGAAGIEGFTGEELTEANVHALVKGYRKNGYNPETKKYDLPPQQSSSLCYAYVNEGISGMTQQEISYKYTRKKGFKKTPVWDINFKDLPPNIPPIEHYISTMEDEELESHVNVFGPYPYPRQQVEETLKDIEYLERRNDEIFRYINDLVDECGFCDERAQEALHEFVPKSWNCRRYGSTCSYYNLCMKGDGWEEPCKYMGFVGRDPNHPIEFEFGV